MKQEEKFWNTIKWSRDKALKFDEIMGKYCIKTILENKKGSRLLDLGCGTGSLTIHFKFFFTKIVGIDASNKHIEYAKKKYNKIKNIEFIHSLIENFSPKFKFDTITLVNLLEHVKYPIKTLKIISNWISNKGVIIIIVPNALTFTRQIAVNMGLLKNEFELTKWDLEIAGHRRTYDLKKLKRHIKLAKLQIVNEGGIFLKTISSPQIDYLLKSILWKKHNYGWGGKGERIDWKKKYCDSCYSIGKKYPNECTNIFITASKKKK